MAIAEKLERLRTTKADIKSAIEEKGQEVGEIPFSAYPEKIRAIEGGGGGLLAPFIDGSLTSLNIPEEVTTLRQRACRSFKITTVTFPSSLTSIGDEAFYNCDYLTNISFPASLKTIGLSAFRDCSQLASVTFLGTPSTIGADGYPTFTDCYNLVDIYAPWPEGTVEGAPWGAKNAQIHYDWK